MNTRATRSVVSWVLRSAVAALCAPVAAGLLGCDPTADERCGDGYVWRDNTCFPIEEDDSDTGEADGGDTGGPPFGLGEPCTDGGDECSGFEADYCALQPGHDTGYCTVDGCSTDPDDCYGEYTCCDFPYSGVPNFCVTPEDYEVLGSTCDG